MTSIEKDFHSFTEPEFLDAQLLSLIPDNNYNIPGVTELNKLMIGDFVRLSTKGVFLWVKIVELDREKRLASGEVATRHDLEIQDLVSFSFKNVLAIKKFKTIRVVKQNHIALLEFLQFNNLEHEDTSVQFWASIQIRTENETIFEGKIKVIVSGDDGLTKIGLYEHEIDTSNFPVVFETDFTIIRYINKDYLQINGRFAGVHSPIGDFRVKIFPLS